MLQKMMKVLTPHSGNHLKEKRRYFPKQFQKAKNFGGFNPFIGEAEKKHADWAYADLGPFSGWH